MYIIQQKTLHLNTAGTAYISSTTVVLRRYFRYAKAESLRVNIFLGKFARKRCNTANELRLVCLSSVRLSARHNSRTAEKIFTAFDFGEFY
jgi:hypothetical protein